MRKERGGKETTIIRYEVAILLVEDPSAMPYPTTPARLDRQTDKQIWIGIYTQDPESLYSERNATVLPYAVPHMESHQDV